MRLSLATRIVLGYAVVLVTFGAVSLFSVGEMHRGQVELKLLGDGYLHLSQDTAAIETFHKSRERETERLSEEKSVETRRALIRLSRKYFPPLMHEKLEAAQATAAQLEGFAPDDEKAFLAGVSQKLKELGTRYTDYEQVAEAAYGVLELDSFDPLTAASRVERMRGTENSIGVSIRLLHAALETRIAERVARAQDRERRTGLLVVLLPVAAIAVGLVVFVVSARSLRPIRTLTLGVARIGKGDYSAEIGLKGEDEIALLGREFDTMARSLREREAQLRQKQQELLQAERLAAVGRLAAQISHEVRNPLSSIGLNTEMLEEQLASAHFDTPAQAEEATGLLRSVTREVDRLTELTEDYLRLARLPQPALQTEDLHGVVERVLAFSAAELERSKVKVVRELAPEPVYASIDEGQLRQVVLNLVRNAREAMAGGGTLTVRTALDGEWAVLEVQDSGAGVDPSNRGKIFEPFFSTKSNGTGLGLSLSAQIVAAHGGRLELLDRRPGATFAIRVKRA
ncbi:MAG: HAMP domain-containing protein [Myxococcaceae bacterium]|nr:HAMP domain-containing protein [Myxococcaceae bacterium]